MFSIWKKLGGTTIFIIFVCIFFIVCDYLLMKRINILFIVLLLMYLWLDIRNIIWYFVLKKRGVILNVPYFIEVRNVNNKKKKFFLVKYITEDGSEVKLYGDCFIKNVNNLADKGKVNLLVDPKNYRNYFMSFETITK